MYTTLATTFYRICIYSNTTFKINCMCTLGLLYFSFFTTNFLIMNILDAYQLYVDCSEICKGAFKIFS